MTKDKNNRYNQVVRMSVLGIVANIALAAMKAIVGIIAGSIAVVLDAVNSLTDAFASLATIIGEKIANMRPTRKHPYGFGRVEYVTSVVIAAFIIAAGIISARESIIKIIHPSEPDYTAITITVLVVATVVKVALGIVFVKRGDAIKSQPLRASGIDALYDAILTAGTLVAAVVCLATHFDVDGWVGLIISFFVIKAGVDVLRDAIASIIGERPDDKTVAGIRKLIGEHDGVEAVYDLMIDSFGPGRIWVTCRVEVRDDMPASEIHELTRHLSEDLEADYGAKAIIGIYATNSTGDFAEIRKKLNEVVDAHPAVSEVHGFYVDEPDNHIDFDIVVDFKHDPGEVRAQIIDEMRNVYPQYTYHVITDLDYA